MRLGFSILRVLPALLTLLAVPGGIEAQSFRQSATLVGTAGVPNVHQGTAVAISGDGATALVGGATGNSVWAFRRSGEAWIENGHIASPGFNTSVVSLALSYDGTTALIGRPVAGDTLVWVRSGNGWTVQAYLSWGGNAVALSADGNTAVIGTRSAPPSGPALVFVRTGSSWSQQASLVGSGASGTGGAGNAAQGVAVALAADGNTAVVSGPSATDVGPFNPSGAVWVFTRSGTSWKQQGGRLAGTAAGGVAQLGASVAIAGDGNTVVTGGPWGAIGAVWVFTRVGDMWTQQGPQLFPAGATVSGVGSAAALSADGDTALVGAPGSDGQTGAVVVFRRSCGGWVQVGGTITVDGVSGWAFVGQSLALSADGATAVVGGPGARGGGGAAWVLSGSDLAIAYRRWLPVVIRKDVPSKGAAWRSDAAVLNTTPCTANVTINLHTAAGVQTTSATLLPNAQWLLPDVAGGMGVVADSGPLEVLSDVAVAVTARTYNRVDDTHTYGQGYHGDDPFSVVSAGHSGWLPQLLQDPQHRTNIGVTNIGATAANVTVALFNGVGTPLWSDTRDFAPAEFYQYQEPFLAVGGTDNGYATVTVNRGEGVTAYASVIDQATNDPTTIDLRIPKLVDGNLTSDAWVPVVVHKDVPSKGASWRSDVSVTNRDGRDDAVWVTLFDPQHPGTVLATREIGLPSHGQIILRDAAGWLGLTAGSSSLLVRANTNVVLANRTTNRVDATHAFGQGYEGVGDSALVNAGQEAWLPQLVQNARFRTNVGITCASTGSTGANVTLTLYDAQGRALWSDTRDFFPSEFYQYQEPFAFAGGTDNGYAVVSVNSGAGITAYASVIDQNTGDPTTVMMSR